MNQNNEELTVFKTEPSALAVMTQTELDSQITVAQRHPRSLSRFKQMALAYATQDLKTAEDCCYVLKHLTDQKTKEPIQGPSVRLAEIAISCWGNVRILTRFVEESEKFIMCQGIAHDLETNTQVSVEVRRSIWDGSEGGKKKGWRRNEHGIQVAVQAGQSIAYRNAAFKVIPKALIDPIYYAAKSLVLSDSDSILERRAGALAWFSSRGVSEELLLKFLQVDRIDAIDGAALFDLTSTRTAILDGEMSVADLTGGKVILGNRPPKVREGKNVFDKPAKTEQAPKQNQPPKQPEPEPEESGGATPEAVCELYRKKIKSAKTPEALSRVMEDVQLEGGFLGPYAKELDSLAADQLGTINGEG